MIAFDITWVRDEHHVWRQEDEVVVARLSVQSLSRSPFLRPFATRMGEFFFSEPQIQKNWKLRIKTCKVRLMTRENGGAGNSFSSVMCICVRLLSNVFNYTKSAKTNITNLLCLYYHYLSLSITHTSIWARQSSTRHRTLYRRDVNDFGSVHSNKLSYQEERNNDVMTNKPKQRIKFVLVEEPKNDITSNFDRSRTSQCWRRYIQRIGWRRCWHNNLTNISFNMHVICNHKSQDNTRHTCHQHLDHWQLNRTILRHLFAKIVDLHRSEMMTTN